MRLLQNEIDWIKSHPEFYEGPMHQKAVIENVKKRYSHRKLIADIDRFTQSLTACGPFCIVK